MKQQEFHKKVKSFLSEQLNLTEYLDISAADTNIRNNIPFRGPNVYILFVAVIMASIGLNVNSIPVIIGAMLISPLMSPIMGFGLGLGTNDTSLLLKSLKHLGIMVAVSLLASTLYFILTPLESDNPTELLARTNPSIYDVMIAFFGGIAGILEVSRKEKGVVISGVAIATALMPPLCTVGYGLANLNWHYFSGALYLFFINCVFIALATFLMVKYLHFPKVSIPSNKSYRQLISYGLLVVVIIVPSIFSAVTIARENRFATSVRHFVKDNQAVGGTYIYNYTTNTRKRPYTLTLHLAGEKLSNDSRVKLYSAAEKEGITRNQILFKEDATIEVRRLNETEVMKDWLESTESQLRQHKDSIRVLLKQIESYKALELPTAQIGDELRAQWPIINKVTLARSESVVILLIELQESLSDGSAASLSENELARIENWLTIRLGIPSAHIIVL